MTDTDLPEAGTVRPQVSTRDRDDIRLGLERWLRRRRDDAAPTIVELTAPQNTGMSSDTVLFTVEWRDGTRIVDTDALVARLAPDPDAAPLFPEYDLERQFLVMEAVGAHSAVPVPPRVGYEPDPSFVGTSFLVMERVDGTVPTDIPPYTFGDGWVAEASADERAAMQRASVEVLVGLHAIPDAVTTFPWLAPTDGRSPLRAHVDHERAFADWVLPDRDGPLIERGFAWLEDRWPEEGPTVLSWGDARIGNLLYRDFTPVAVLDWEMATVGPRELDVAWMIYLHRFFDDLALRVRAPRPSRLPAARCGRRAVLRADRTHTARPRLVHRLRRRSARGDHDAGSACARCTSARQRCRSTSTTSSPTARRSKRCSRTATGTRCLHERRWTGQDHAGTGRGRTGRVRPRARARGNRHRRRDAERDRGVGARGHRASRRRGPAHSDGARLRNRQDPAGRRRGHHVPDHGRPARRRPREPNGRALRAPVGRRRRRARRRVVRTGVRGRAGRVHGGMVAAVFDDILGMAMARVRSPGFTGRLTVHYRAPVPMNQRIEFRAWGEEPNGRKLVVHSEARLDGRLLAEAEALFILVDPADFATHADDLPVRGDQRT